jgi:hypothetical protein
MRSALRYLVSSGARAVVTVLAVPAGLLLAIGGVASADVTSAQADTGSTSFGVLGPVGLAAVALGIVGMTLGVLRQRRKARAAGAGATVVIPVVPATPDAQVPGAVTAMAEAVLADADQTPTRPFLAPHPHG